MKLSSAQIQTVKTAIQVDPLPEDNPAFEQLQQAFGDHTFYVGEDGLLVFEPANDVDEATEPARLILVAAWTDEEKKALSPVQPKGTQIIVDMAEGVPKNGDAS